MDAPDPQPDDEPQGSRWATAGWIASAVVLLVVIVGVFLQVRNQQDGTAVANALLRGDRPAAPALPTAQLDGDGAPGLPEWYEPRGAGQAAAPMATGHVMVVNFWASWCAPCRDEAPILRSVAREYEDDDVVVVGVNAAAEDIATDARSFVKEYDLDFPIVLGSRTDKEAWGIGGYPETFIVGKDGRVASHVNGPVEEDTLRELLERELERT